MRQSLLLSLGLLVVACGGRSLEDGYEGAATGGTRASGGFQGDGGAAVGGWVASGGTSDGGYISPGGGMQTGGWNGTGSTVATGGWNPAGGASGTGAWPATGGVLVTGGAWGTGGISVTGGTWSTGGSVGTGGYVGGGGGIIDACVQSSTTACQSCLCKTCANEVIACFSDVGCLFITDCIGRTGCSGYECLANRNCGKVISQYGQGSLGLAVGIGQCAVVSSCGC